MSNNAKEKAFLEKCLTLSLPQDFSQTVYLFLSSNIITPEGFYQIFKETNYDNEIVFNKLEIMLNNQLLMIDKEDEEIGFDDTCFLILNPKYDPMLLVRE